VTDTTNEVTNEGGETEVTLTPEQPQNEQPEQTADATPEPSTGESTSESGTQDGGADQSPDSDSQGGEDFKVTIPDTMNFPDAAIAAITEAAQSKGITSEQAQAMLDAVAPTIAEANAKMVEETREEWSRAIENDPKLGGDKLAENMAFRDKAIETFGDEGLAELLNDGDLPLGKEPGMFRLLVKVGRAISEAPAVNGGETAEPVKPFTGDVFNDADRAAAAMYGPNKK